MAYRRSQREDAIVYFLSVNVSAVPSNLRADSWDHWLSERLILFNCIPFACCFVYIHLPSASPVRVFLLCVRSVTDSQRGSGLLD